MLRPYRDIDIAKLHRYLRDCVRHGARAPRLLRHVPDIIDMLYPANEYPHLSDHERAQNTENDIRSAIVDIGGPAADALATVLGLQPGTMGRTLTDRRRLAGHHLGVEADTFRRPWNERALLADLAHEIHHKHQPRKAEGLHSHG
jgi:hypothetical protein